MKDMTTKDWVEYKLQKMRMRRNVSFRAFAINWVLIFVVWMISMTPMYEGLMEYFMHTDAVQSQMFILDMIGLWKILNVVFFLVPALAIWWEMHAFEKEFSGKK